jgi:glycosyltransferase involved in cell wall biosynthesis
MSLGHDERRAALTALSGKGKVRTDAGNVAPSPPPRQGRNASVSLTGHRLRELAVGPPPAPDRIFYHNIWFRGHNNPRYAALLPRLRRLDPYLVTCAEQRIVRGIQFRAHRASRRLRNRLLFAAANRRYRYLFSSDIEQIPYFHGPVVVDMDDPRFRPIEVDLMSRPNVRAYVVTTEQAAQRYQQLGLEKPYHVIPQGVSLDVLEPDRAVRIAADRKRPGDVVVGYVAAYLRSRDDRQGDNPLYNADHLLELWEAIRDRAPNARLWLIGEPSDRVRRACAGRDDVVLFGRLSSGEALAHVANFDIALYPRRVDHAPFPVKIAEYLGLGVPTVAYHLELSRFLSENGAGLTVETPNAFVDAVCGLALDERRRTVMARAAHDAGKGLDMAHLASRYEREVLDRYLS